MTEVDIILVICKILQESRIVKFLFMNRSHIFPSNRPVLTTVAISHVIANQKQREREKSKWLIRVFRRNSGFRLGLIYVPNRLQFPFRFPVCELLPEPFILTSLYIPSPCVQ